MRLTRPAMAMMNRIDVGEFIQGTALGRMDKDGKTMFDPVFPAMVVNGPPSSGKTTTFEHYLKQVAGPVVWVDFRNVTFDSSEHIQHDILSVIKQNHRRMNKIKEQGPAALQALGILVSGLGAMAGVDDVTGAVGATMTKVGEMWEKIIDDPGLSPHAKLQPLVQEFANARQKLPADQRAFVPPFVLGFDEMNLIKPRSAMDPTTRNYARDEDNAKADLFDMLMAMTTRLTKQRKIATVVHTTSDQQFAMQYGNVIDKGFAQSFSFGYMPKQHVLEYLKEEYGVEGAVAEAVHDTCGGHFTHLQYAAHMLKRGQQVEDVLGPMRRAAMTALQRRLEELTDEQRSEVVPVMNEHFSSGDAVSMQVVKKKVGKNLFDRMIALNLVHVRSTEVAVLCRDLVGASSLPADVLTPYTPIDGWNWRNTVQVA